MFYIVITATQEKCGPLKTEAEAHQKGTMWYGTGNFTIEPVETKGKAKAAPEEPAE